MNQRKPIGIIIYTIIIIALCIGVYFLAITFLKPEEKQIGENTNTVQNEVKEEEENFASNPIFTKETYPKVDCSTATKPLAKAFSDYFTGEKTPIEEVTSSKTHGAYVNLIEKKADLILVVDPSEEELMLAQQNNVEFEKIPVVREGFVFYVNQFNTVEDLTVEQIQNIYTGTTTNWSELGGEDIPITAYQRPNNSGSQTGMLSLVMQDKPIMEPKKENIMGDMGSIINMVSEYSNEKSAIGYSYYYYANTMYKGINQDAAEKIKLLGVNGIKPTNDTIRDGSYPFQTSYYIVIRKDEPENSNTRKLVQAMLSAEGQNVAEEAGYVAVTKE